MSRAAEHDRDLADAFDGQAARFERAPVQSDPAALRRLVDLADLPPGTRVLDAGCGPGLVAEALLEAGCRVVGVDLSAEMVGRAARRCARYADRARFVQGSIFEIDPGGPFDAAVSRYVVHHLDDPLGFVRRQAELIRRGGAVVVCDHTTDPDPDRAGWHRAIEVARDRTHTANLTPGGLADLLASAGLEAIRLAEEPFTLDFDEWFGRGTPSRPGDEVRAAILDGPGARGFAPRPRPDGGLDLDCWRAVARGLKTRPA